MKILENSDIDIIINRMKMKTELPDKDDFADFWYIVKTIILVLDDLELIKYDWSKEDD